MTDPISIVVSVLALGLSSVTAWFTFRQGTIKMTQPTVIFLGPDLPRSSNELPAPKIYLRTLLFSTSKRGRIIQSMHVALSRNETRQNFNIWVYGENRLVRGSGLFVGETGVEANHHFLMPKDASSFRFIEGQYQLDVYVQILGKDKQTKLFSQSLEITRELATALAEPNAGLYFDWGPDSSRYLPHIDVRPPSSEVDKFFMTK
jgi:hypothetical protein